MQHAWILSKCKSFRIAVRWIRTKHCSDILYTKVQPYISPIEGLYYFARYVSNKGHLKIATVLLSMTCFARINLDIIIACKKSRGSAAKSQAVEIK